MGDKIVTVNKEAIVNKVKTTASSISERAKSTGSTLTGKAKSTGGRVFSNVRTKVGGVRNKVQNTIVDKSLAVNSFQRDMIEKCRRDT